MPRVPSSSDLPGVAPPGGARRGLVRGPMAGVLVLAALIAFVGVRQLMDPGPATVPDRPAGTRPWDVHPLGDGDPTTWSHPSVVGVDRAPWTREAHIDLVGFDRTIVMQRIHRRDLADQPPWAIAVRLLLGEIGTGRLARNRWSVVEAVGVLQTVVNRLDAAVWNPEGIEGLGGWPGCDVPADTPFEEAFVSCADPEQYLGLARPRSLNPSEYGDDGSLHIAIDRAVMAWWLVAHARIPDVTGGGTMYVHRCGGAAYGHTTPHCDRDPTTPDLPGANSHLGPIAFKAPDVFLKRRGLYRMRLSGAVDYEPGPLPMAPGVVASYLYSRSTDPRDRDPETRRDLRTLEVAHLARQAREAESEAAEDPAEGPAQDTSE